MGRKADSHRPASEAHPPLQLGVRHGQAQVVGVLATNSFPMLRIRNVYSGSQIPYLDFFSHPGYRIKQEQQKRSWKNLFSYLFISHKFQNRQRKIFEPSDKELQCLLPQKNVSLKYGLGIWDPDPGVKKAPDPGSATLQLLEVGFIIHVIQMQDSCR